MASDALSIGSADRPKSRSISQALAAVLTLTLSAPLTPLTVAGTAKLSTMSGHIYSEDGQTPAAGAVIRAVHIITERIYTAQPADASGRFTLGDLPSGYYDVGVDHKSQLFIAGTVVNLSEGGKVALDFVLKPYGNTVTEWWQGEKREIPVLGKEQGVARVLEKSRSAAEGKPFWKKPAGIAIIAIGGAAVIAAAAGGGGGGGDGGGEHASPSQP